MPTRLYFDSWTSWSSFHDLFPILFLFRCISPSSLFCFFFFVCVFSIVCVTSSRATTCTLPFLLLLLFSCFYMHIERFAFFFSPPVYCAVSSAAFFSPSPQTHKNNFLFFFFGDTDGGVVSCYLLLTCQWIGVASREVPLLSIIAFFFCRCFLLLLVLFVRSSVCITYFGVTRKNKEKWQDGV